MLEIMEFKNGYKVIFSSKDKIRTIGVLMRDLLGGEVKVDGNTLVITFNEKKPSFTQFMKELGKAISFVRNTENFAREKED